MRLRAVALVVLIVLAGCNALPTDETTPSPTPTTTTETPTPSTTPTTTTPSTTPATTTPSTQTDQPPANEDVLGRENGIWYNATLSVDASDGLNETERKNVISRSMARVEQIRQLEFKRPVPVSIKSRSEIKQQFGTTSPTEEFRQFDNAKFEALFLVGEKTDSLAVQRTAAGVSVLGYYSPKNDSIVIVSSRKTPMLPGESTLAHELTHALQDQYFNLSSYNRSTRDGYNAENGLIEGEATLVERRYMSHCGNEWECLPTKKNGRSVGPPPNWGVYFLNYFPYADGAAFVNYYQQRGGWDRVSELFSNPPTSTEQVISPPKYGTDQPTNVTLDDRTQNGWSRVRPEPSRPGTTRPDYATLGQSGLTSMFAHTLYDSYNQSGAAIRPYEFVNRKGASINTSDPFDYDLPVTDGWDGDRLHVYKKNGESAYVWKIAWDSPKNASRFATAYEQLLGHWGAKKVGVNTWVIKNGPYADAFSVRVTGETVVIVNAPSVADLSDVRAEQ